MGLIFAKCAEISFELEVCFMKCFINITEHSVFNQPASQPAKKCDILLRMCHWGTYGFLIFCLHLCRTVLFRFRLNYRSSVHLKNYVTLQHLFCIHFNETCCPCYTASLEDIFASLFRNSLPQTTDNFHFYESFKLFAFAKLSASLQCSEIVRL